MQKLSLMCAESFMMIGREMTEP